MATAEEWIAYHRGLAIALGKDPVEAEQAVMATLAKLDRDEAELARVMQANDREARIMLARFLGGLFLLWVAGITLLFFLFQ